MTKKLFVFMLLLITPFIVFAYKPGDKYIKGDADNSGKVTSTDYIIVRKHILKQTTLTGDALIRSDATGDSKITSVDYISIRKMILNGKTGEVVIVPGVTSTPSPTASSATISVTSISLNKTSLTIGVDKSETLVSKINPSNATNKTITWTSSDKNIATVNNGVVSGIKEGSITITATIGDKKATAKVRVSGDAIHFVRTGKGSYGNTIIIESNGEYAIFDASGINNQGPVTDKYLANLGITKDTVIKYVIVSHMHEDHAEYIDDIILKHNVKNIIYKDYDCKCHNAGCALKDDNGDNTAQGTYKDVLNAVKKKNVNRVKLGSKDGSKKINVGNFTLSFYNVNDQLCYGGNKGHASLNVDSLGIVLTIKKGSKEMLTYLAGDMQQGAYDNEEAIANKIAKDYGNKVFDVYQAAHHGINEGIKDSKFKFKYPIITHSIGSYCRRNLDKANGVTDSLPIIYDHMRNNNKLYFSSARSIQVHYTNSGVTISGGEVLECSDKNCKNPKKAWKLLDKKSAKRDKDNKCVRYVLET